MDIFFVLSGFLVSGLIFSEFKRHGDVSVKRFLIRRGFKIYPPFWVVTVGSILIITLIEKNHLTLRQFLGDALFMQNYLGSFTGGTWSLAVEEHFYIFLSSWVVWRLWKQRSHPTDADPFRQLPTMFLIVLAACLAFRIRTWLRVPEFSHPAFLFRTHLRLDSLLWGVLISYFLHFRLTPSLAAKLAKNRTLVVILGCTCLLPAFIFPVEIHRWVACFGVMLFSLGASLLVLATSVHPMNTTNPIIRATAFCGARSYSVYLWHMNMLKLSLLLTPLFVNPGLGWFVTWITFVTASWLVGIAMAFSVEFPALRLRDRWFKSTAI